MIAMVNRQRQHATRLVEHLNGTARSVLAPGVRSTRALARSFGSALEHLGEAIRSTADPGAVESIGEQLQLDDLTTAELYTRAQDQEIRGRSKMNRDDLIAALRDRSSVQ